MEPADAYNWLQVTPALPALSFHFQAPADWALVDLPAEETDFSNPTAFMAALTRSNQHLELSTQHSQHRTNS